MFESVEEAMHTWKTKYAYIEEIKLAGYDGGYPVIDVTVAEQAWDDLIKDTKKISRIVRTAEMEGGIEVGVSTCFYKTAYVKWTPPVMKICGYPEVIDRILKKIL